MNRQGEDFYYMHTLIEVTAPDSETLEQRVTEVEKLCVSVDMIARRCDYKNEQAFLSSLPILALDPDIERNPHRCLDKIWSFSKQQVVANYGRDNKHRVLGE